MAVLAVLWANGMFDRLFAQVGLDMLISGTCLRTLAGAVFCGADEIGSWCREFGKLSAENAAVCIGR